MEFQKVTFIIVLKIARLLVIPKNITKSSKSLVHMKDYLLLIIRFDINIVKALVYIQLGKVPDIFVRNYRNRLCFLFFLFYFILFLFLYLFLFKYKKQYNITYDSHLCHINSYISYSHSNISYGKIKRKTYSS